MSYLVARLGASFHLGSYFVSEFYPLLFGLSCGGDSLPERPDEEAGLDHLCQARNLGPRPSHRHKADQRRAVPVPVQRGVGRRGETGGERVLSGGTRPGLQS